MPPRDDRLNPVEPPGIKGKLQVFKCGVFHVLPSTPAVKFSTMQRERGAGIECHGEESARTEE